MEDVLVVGAGLAGLSLARALAHAGRSVRVLEARDRVGGRTLSQQIDGAPFDLGGQWIGRGHDRLERLARDLGVATFPQYATGARVMEVCGKVSTYTGTIPKLSPLKLVQLQVALTAVRRLEQRVDPKAPRDAKGARALDAMSVEQLARKWLVSDATWDLFASAVRVVFGAEPRDVSALYFLSYARAGGGFEALVESEKGAQAGRFVPGAQALSLGLAAELGDRVVLSAPVHALEQHADGVTVTTSQGTHRARYAVLAVPPTLWSRIEFSPDLPVLHDQVAQRSPMGATVKCLATYERPFWRDAGLSGEAVCDVGPVSVTFDATSGDRAALVAFVVGQDARAWSGRPAAARRSAILDVFARLFGPRALEPRVYHEHDWSTERWTRGCPVAALGPGVLTSCDEARRAPFGRVHVAGTESATEHAGYLEGALESAERVYTELSARWA